MNAVQYYVDERQPYIEILTKVVYKGQYYTYRYVHQYAQEYDDRSECIM